ncbi:MAG: alkaline phosphatase D family protein [Akkermansiaceae bacterium]|nr:alkaline phosphatase D family protein [Akkermansiaceae bacterium]
MLPSVLAGQEQTVEVHPDRTLSRIAFGSCLKNPKGGDILDEVIKYQPDLFVWLGDNVYVDTWGQPERFDQLYGQLGANPRFRKLGEACPQLAIWDDHDYGHDNQDKTYPLKEQSKAAFGRFWKIPESSTFWSREGIYRAHEYGKPGKRVQVVLLDGRWHLDKANARQPDSYLGKAQWAWLEQVLKRPAELRLICSGVQVVKLNDNGAEWEMWGDHPGERKRLFELIERTKANGVIFLSGDMHFAEIYKTTDTGYSLYDITASGLDQAYPHAGKALPGPQQVGKSLIRSTNFGGVVIDWPKRTLKLELLDGEGGLFLSHPVALEELRPR